MAEVTTVIGDTIRFVGNLQGDEDLTVRGRVEGTIQLTRALIVEPTGVVKADVSVQNAVISGVVVGNVTASDSVEITQEGRMVGDIAAPRVILVDGASFRGQVDMGNLEGIKREPVRRAVAAPSRPAAPPARKPEARVAAAPQQAARPEPVKAAPEARAEPAKKASLEAPKPRLMTDKKRKVVVKKH
ncbi:MAG: polymer-forming cytoskeletal protein [Deltaproteobacteria bacterium]|nr:polymer-forming cytoskeletal protein [Deltaproteobacteria bacterium]